MPPAASWGTMLQEAASVRAIADYPWVLVPALAIALVVLALNLALGERGGEAAERPQRQAPNADCRQPPAPRGNTPRPVTASARAAP